MDIRGYPGPWIYPRISRALDRIYPGPSIQGPGYPWIGYPGPWISVDIHGYPEISTRNSFPRLRAVN
eukprot:2492805-Prymnesium_polylepis.1